jgi:Tfp pilus assembly protein PilE
MHKSNIQRRYITLIEIMIVMFLIAIITGVIAYNYRGSLEEGKAFKTATAIQKVETILNMEVARNPESAKGMSTEWEKYVIASPLVHDARALTVDGWGERYEVHVDPESGAVKVSSKRLDEYRQTHHTLFTQ